MLFAFPCFSVLLSHNINYTFHVFFLFLMIRNLPSLAALLTNLVLPLLFLLIPLLLLLLGLSSAPALKKYTEVLSKPGTFKLYSQGERSCKPLKKSIFTSKFKVYTTSLPLPPLKSPDASSLLSRPSSTYLLVFLMFPCPSRRLLFHGI